MSRVRITVDSRTLGDVDIEQESTVGFWDSAAERKQVGDLILRALDMVRKA